MNFEREIHEKIRAQGKAKNTAKDYCKWVRRYLAFCSVCGLGKGTKAEDAAERWLSVLANEGDVSANTQNQAFAAICFFYRHVLQRPLENVSALRAKRPDRIREVLDQSEILQLFSELEGIPLLAAKMMYGCAFRIGEVGRLRIKDISFERRQIAVRGGKGKKDRIVGFPEQLHEPIREQIDLMRRQWRGDVERKRNGVSLPEAWGRKAPRSRLEFAWWYLFASGNYSKCPASGILYRHHRDMGHVARCIKEASMRAGIPKRITSHCLRHSHATHMLESGEGIHVVQRLLGHNDIRTTETYLHVAKDGVTSARSPLDDLQAASNGTDRPQLRLYAG